MLDDARKFLAWAIPDPGPDRYLNLHWTFTGGDGKTAWSGYACETVDEAIKHIDKQMWVNNTYNKTSDIYVCMSTQSQFRLKGTSKRPLRFQRNAVELKSLFIDIDVKEDKGYASRADAERAIAYFIKVMGLPLPTFTVSSGSGGFHIHWVFEEALPPALWQELAEALWAAMQTHGIKADPIVTDAARILRVPGTKNYKHGTANPVVLEPYKTELVSLEVMEAALAPYRGIPAPKSNVVAFPRNPAPVPGGVNDDLGADLNDRRPITLEEVAKECPFVANAAQTGGIGQSEAEWFLTGVISTFLTDGLTAYHQMSDKYAGYTADETNDKFGRIQRVVKERNIGWPSCAKLHRDGAKECATCPHFQEAQERDLSPLNFVQVTKPGVARPPATTALPYPYSRNKDGLVLLTKRETDGEKETESSQIICPYPIYEGWLSSEPTWKLHFRTKTHPGSITLAQVDLRDINIGKDGLTKILSDFGFAMTPGEWKDMKGFLVAWVTQLQQSKEGIRSTFPYGWVEADGSIMGFAFGGTVWTPNGERLAASADRILSAQYQPTGKIDKWKEATKMLNDQHRPAIDAILAVAFAGPLVYFTGHAGLIFNAYSSETGIGKTTAMKISQAVWGHPNKARQRLDDTRNSVLKKVGQVKSLPIYWDEIKGEAEVKNFTSIVFPLAEGREKTRLDANLNQQESGDWKTMMVSATNESIVDVVAQQHKGTTAAQHRLFEFRVPATTFAIPDMGRIDRLVMELERNFGQAGLIYAQWLGKNWEQVKHEVEDLHDALLRESKGLKQEERLWIVTIVVLLLGSVYANKLGLTNIDVRALKSFLFNVLDENRVEIGMSTNDMSRGENLEEIFTDFLNSNVQNTLWTTSIHSGGPGRPPKGSIAALDTSHIRELGIQRCTLNDTVIVSGAFFRRWAMGKKINTKVWIDRMKSEYGMLVEPGRVGAGVAGIEATKQQVFIIDGSIFDGGKP